MDLDVLAIWLSAGALGGSGLALWVSWAGFRQSHKPRVAVEIEMGKVRNMHLGTFRPGFDGGQLRVTIRNSRSAPTAIEELTLEGRWPRTEAFRILNTWPTFSWPIALEGRSSIQLLIDPHEQLRTVHTAQYDGHPAYRAGVKLGDGRIVTSRWRPWWWPTKPSKLPTHAKQLRQRWSARRARRAGAIEEAPAEN